IAALRQNSRKSLTQLSKEIKIPISTLHEKIESYKNNLIKKNTAIIDFEKIGYNTRANVLLKIERDKRQELQEYLSKCHNVNCLLKVNNGFDFLVEFIFEHIKELEDFMEILEQKFPILNRETYYIIDDLKREEFMANPQLIAMNAE
ncbi:MAG: hypothetical protein KKA65_03190, partial [Nanoarchaeota archaeon]|nr:hypothetical protein [Nanoarchaeota archaeon]MCG2719766.1 hypothetical protein [Nanoarchaeota archaeon]